MSIFSRKVSQPQPLDMQAIAALVKSYLSQRGDIALNLDEVSQEELAGTPQWTFVQCLDNYLLAVFNKEVYEHFLHHDKSSGMNILPDKQSKSLEFCFSLFKFLVMIRTSLSREQQELICKNAERNVKGKYFEYQRQFLECFSEDMVSELQKFELSLDNPTDTDEFDELMEYNVNDNRNLLNYYLSIRHDFAMLI